MSAAFLEKARQAHPVGSGLVVWTIEVSCECGRWCGRVQVVPDVAPACPFCAGRRADGTGLLSPAKKHPALWTGEQASAAYAAARAACPPENPPGEKVLALVESLLTACLCAAAPAEPREHS